MTNPLSVYSFQYFHTPSEYRSSHSPAPAQQGSQEAPPSSPGLRRDHPPPALCDLQFRDRKKADEPQKSGLTELPIDIQAMIAQSLDPASIAQLRLTCKALKPAASQAVKHVIVNKREDLQTVIETYKEGGITTLTVTDNDLTDDDLLLLKKDLPSLERLNLAECRKLTDAGLAHLRSLTALRQLNLAGCRELTDAGLAHLRALTALQQLNLAGCWELTDAGLAAHLPSLTSLQQLNLAGCCRLTGAGVRRLRDQLRSRVVTICIYTNPPKLRATIE